LRNGLEGGFGCIEVGNKDTSQEAEAEQCDGIVQIWKTVNIYIWQSCVLILNPALNCRGAVKAIVVVLYTTEPTTKGIKNILNAYVQLPPK
jgi:hypothetical protein